MKSSMILVRFKLTSSFSSRNVSPQMVHFRSGPTFRTEFLHLWHKNVFDRVSATNDRLSEADPPFLREAFSRMSATVERSSTKEVLHFKGKQIVWNIIWLVRSFVEFCISIGGLSTLKNNKLLIIIFFGHFCLSNMTFLQYYFKIMELRTSCRLDLLVITSTLIL